MLHRALLTTMIIVGVSGAPLGIEGNVGAYNGQDEVTVYASEYCGEPEIDMSDDDEIEVDMGDDEDIEF